MLRTRQSGFTLIELLIVVALIGIALSVISLSFSKSMNSAKVQAASRDLVAALRYTRGQAIVRNKQAALDLDTQNNTYQAPGKPLVLPKEMHMTRSPPRMSKPARRPDIRFSPTVLPPAGVCRSSPGSAITST